MTRQAAIVGAVLGGMTIVVVADRWAGRRIPAGHLCGATRADGSSGEIDVARIGAGPS